MDDAKECRDRALQCIRLAKGLPEGKERNSYADLARSWRRLGRGIEKSEAALDAWASSEREPNPVGVSNPCFRGELITLPSEPMTMWPISTRVNKPENNDPMPLERTDDPFEIWASLEWSAERR
jgi:hypothetical protein